MCAFPAHTEIAPPGAPIVRTCMKVAGSGPVGRMPSGSDPQVADPLASVLLAYFTQTLFVVLQAP